MEPAADAVVRTEKTLTSPAYVFHPFATAAAAAGGVYRQRSLACRELASVSVVTESGRVQGHSWTTTKGTRQ